MNDSSRTRWNLRCKPKARGQRLTPILSEALHIFACECQVWPRVPLGAITRLAHAPTTACLRLRASHAASPRLLPQFSRVTSAVPSMPSNGCMSNLRSRSSSVTPAFFRNMPVGAYRLDILQPAVLILCPQGSPTIHRGHKRGISDWTLECEQQADDSQGTWLGPTGTRRKPASRL